MGSRFIINHLSSSEGELVLQPWKGGDAGSADIGGQVLIHSGGSAHSTDFSEGSDVNFYVSGSLNKRGTYGSYGTAVFGGDLLTSGAFYLGEVTPGSAPTAGLGVVYVKSDGSNDHLYYKSNDVSEVKLSGGSGAGDITGVTAGVGLSGGGTSGGVTLTVDFSEFSVVAPASGDKLATMDSDGANEQLTTVDALASLYAGTASATGLSASSGVLSVSDLHPVGVDGAANNLLTDDGDGTVTSEGNLSYDGTSMTMASSAASTPLLTVTNTHAGATSGALKFLKDGASAADNDTLGEVQFFGEDSAGNKQEFGNIKVQSTAVATTSEKGSMIFGLACTDDGGVDTIMTLAGGAAGATSTVTIAGNLTVNGATTTVSTTNLLVSDKLITLNDGGAAASGTGVGLEIEEDGAATGYIKTDGTGDWTLRGAGSAASTVLTVDVNATKTLTIGGSLNVEGDSNIDQDLSSNSTAAQFATLTIATSLVPDAAGGADLGSTGAEWGDLYIADDKAIHFGTEQEAKIEYDEDGSDQLHIHAPAAGVLISGTTPTLTIGDAGAEDTKIVFDGNAQDFHIGLDDTDDKLKIGLGSAVGTTPNMVLYSAARTVEFLGGVVIPDAGSIGSATDTNAITISSAGVVALTSTTVASSTSTGALTVAGGASVADDFWVGDNLRLASDGAILSLGIGHDITLIHDGGTGATLASAGAFVIDGAAAVTIDSDAALTVGAASMDIDADGGAIDIDATAAVSIDSSAGSVTMGAILADGQTLTLGKTGATAMVFTPHGTVGSEKISVTNTAGTHAEAIMVESAAGGITLETNSSKNIALNTSTVDVSNQATDIDIKAGTAAALEFNITGVADSQMLAFNTNDNSYATAVRVLHGESVSDNYFATFQVGNWAWGENGNSDAFMMVSGTIGGKTGGAGGSAFEPAGVSVYGGDLVVSGALYVGEVTPASAPGNGLGSVYVKNDGSNDHLYFRSHDVSEVKLSGGGGSSLDAANGANDRIATFSDSDSLNGEANLTFDGTDLSIAGTGKVEFGSAAAYINHDGTDLQIVDDADINLKPATNLLVDAGGDIILDAAGNNVTLKSAGTTSLDFVLTAGGLVTLDAPANICLDADGGEIIFKDGGTEIAVFENSASNFEIWASVQDKDIRFKGNVAGNDGVTLGYFDTSAGGTLYTKNMAVTGSSGVTTVYGGTGIAVSSGDYTADVAGDIILDADGGDVYLKDAGTTFLQFTSANSAADVNITNGAADGDLIFADAGGNEVFRMDGGEEALLVASTKKVMFGSTAAYINHDGTDLQIVDDADINLKPAVDLLVDAGGDIHLDAGGSNINFKEAGTTFASINEDGADAYLNFGATAGTSGYGIQDDGGTIKIKNSGGGWAVPVFNGFTSIEVGDSGDSLSYAATSDDTTLTSAAGGDKLYIDSVTPVMVKTDTSNNGIQISQAGLTAQQVDIADSAMQVSDAAIEITAAASGAGADAKPATQLSTTYYSGGKYTISLQATASGGSHWATVEMLVVSDGTTCTVSEQRVDTGALGADVLELTSVISSAKIIIKAQNVSSGAITNLKTNVLAQGMFKLS